MSGGVGAADPSCAVFHTPLESCFFGCHRGGAVCYTVVFRIIAEIIPLCINAVACLYLQKRWQALQSASGSGSRSDTDTVLIFVSLLISFLKNYIPECYLSWAVVSYHNDVHLIFPSFPHVFQSPLNHVPSYSFPLFNVKSISISEPSSAGMAENPSGKYPSSLYTHPDQ